MLKGFRDFILRGNVVDLAVAVILGAAFNAIVTFAGQRRDEPVDRRHHRQAGFQQRDSHVGGGQIKIGNFLNAAVSFLIVASVVYFAIVLPMNALLARIKKPEDAGRTHHKAVPRMPQRHSAGREALRTLRSACA